MVLILVKSYILFIKVVLGLPIKSQTATTHTAKYLNSCWS